MTLDPDRLWTALEGAAEKKASAEQNAHLLERLGEILLAKMQVEAKHEGNPVGICKEIARSRDEWEIHVRGEAEAIGQRSRARATYENMKIKYEAMRTLEVTNRTLTR